MPEVKVRRRYDASRRQEQAARTRSGILDIARQQLLESGYAATTIAGIAAQAEVSVETVYKAFGGKSGVVRALWERGLRGSQGQGRGAVPAPARSDALSTSESDPRVVLRGWGRLTTEVAPEVGPIMLLIRAASASDPDMAELLAEAEGQRRERMRRNARRLQRRGWLRPGLSVTQASDILWTYSSAEFYDLLVLKSGWSAGRYGDFVGEALIAALLPPVPSRIATAPDRRRAADQPRLG
ncbi:TetR family transcriptional regulator [Jatrophihabitans telluris]|uniref:TetR family transcriptional regulator n=1 Tax=Jatrophihabitans telluris TaxID=2038343 RepID=A0ABY4QVI7_9ACTN|nr:TetR family transcriptional regulator [Jatrophihabitans telluris]UQX87443.1 TetR family transcriptional regulator [Jatrophihabitans telluris]